MNRCATIKSIAMVQGKKNNSRCVRFLTQNIFVHTCNLNTE